MMMEEQEQTLKQSTKAKTSSRPVQRYRAILFQAALITAIVAFTFLTILVETTPSFPIDLQITRAVQSIRSPFFAGLMQYISWPGFVPQSILITALIGVVLYAYGLRWESVMSLIAAMFSGLANELLKRLIQRPRPTTDVVDVFAILTSYSFPSGHVMFYTIVFGFAWYVIYTVLQRSVLRSVLLMLLGSLILLVGVSRISLGQHWASDVLGAYLVGGIMLAGIILLYQWGRNRFFVRLPADQDLKST
jgi:undecaprenyl-diphosphatase